MLYYFGNCDPPGAISCFIGFTIRLVRASSTCVTGICTPGATLAIARIRDIFLSCLSNSCFLPLLSLLAVSMPRAFIPLLFCPPWLVALALLSL